VDPVTELQRGPCYGTATWTLLRNCNVDPVTELQHGP